MSDSHSSPDPYAPTGSGGYGPYGTAPQSYGSPPGAPQPHGQQPYGPPPGMPQPYGYPGGTYAYGPPPQPQGTNGFAIAGLVLGILPVLAGIPGIVFGAVGIQQIKRTGQKGRGMALAGIILGSLWLALIAVLVTVGIVAGSSDQTSSSTSPAPVFPSVYPTPSSSSSTGSSGGSGGDSESAFQVKVGDCLRSTPSGEVRSVDLVSCSRPHAVEAYANFDLPGSSFPGTSRVSSLSQAGCKTRFPGFVGTTYDQSSLDVYFLHPTEQSWTVRHDREVLCLVGSDTKQTTGTLRDAHR